MQKAYRVLNGEAVEPDVYDNLSLERSQALTLAASPWCPPEVSDWLTAFADKCDALLAKLHAPPKAEPNHWVNPTGALTKQPDSMSLRVFPETTFDMPDLDSPQAEPAPASPAYDPRKGYDVLTPDAAYWKVRAEAANERANRLADECGILRSERDELLKENAVLRRENERLKRGKR